MLQLARAYAVLAADGIKRPVRLVKAVGGHQEAGQSGNTAFAGQQVLSSNVAREVRSVMQQVVDRGTGRKAQVAGYSVAGKTGTVHKSSSGKYLESAYRATFAGMLPVDKPRLVAVVTVDEPKGKKYYGGEVAAPAFARVMSQAARILGIPPDQIDIQVAGSKSGKPSTVAVVAQQSLQLGAR